MEGISASTSCSCTNTRRLDTLTYMNPSPLSRISTAGVLRSINRSQEERETRGMRDAQLYIYHDSCARLIVQNHVDTTASAVCTLICTAVSTCKYTYV